MKRLYPSIIRFEINSEEEQKPLLGLQVRRKGKVDSRVYVYRKMVDTFGDEIESKDIVELSKYDDDNYDITKDIQHEHHNELIDEGIDDSISKKMNKHKYVYYEYFEMVESLGKTSDVTMMLVNEQVLMDQSEDTHDSEDSNSEGYYANSYPSTPSTSSEDEYRNYYEDDSDEVMGNYLDSDDFDDYGELKKKKKHKDDYYDNYFGEYDTSSSDSDYNLNEYAENERRNMMKDLKMEVEDDDSDDEMVNMINTNFNFNSMNSVNNNQNNYNQQVVSNERFSEETDSDEICILKRKKPKKNKDAMEEESD